MSRIRRLAASAACIGVVSIASADVVFSDFGSDADGWMIADGDSPQSESTTAAPVHFANYGNTGGFISPPLAWSRTAFFVAPTKFLGDQSGKVGGYVTIDRRLWEPRSNSEPNQEDFAIDLTITGVGGTSTLAVDMDLVPVQAWGTQAVELSQAGGWFHLGTGIAATDAEISAVLADLDDIRVRGNLNSAGGNLGMDNFGMVPAPTTLAVLALAGLTATKRRR